MAEIGKRGSKWCRAKWISLVKKIQQMKGEENGATNHPNSGIHRQVTKVMNMIRKNNQVGDSGEQETQQEQDDFLKRVGMGERSDAQQEARLSLYVRLRDFVVNPSGEFYYRWLGVVTIAALYNLVVVIARAVFNQMQTPVNFVYWATADYIADLIFIADMAVKSRKGYLEQGLLVKEKKKLAKNYMKSTVFIFDVIAVIPTDISYAFTYFHDNPIMRLNRCFKLPSAFDFQERTETRTSWPNAFRIFCVILYIVIIIHWNGCIYFAISKSIGLGYDSWVYGVRNVQSRGQLQVSNTSDPETNQTYMVFADTLARRYIYSFYWSTITLTTIGETPYPVSDEEFLFVNIDYLIGILIFATIVGNVGNMIASMSASRTEFQNKMDAIKQYMEFRKVGKELETRVIKWFDYLWSNAQSLSDEAVLASLPAKLRAEIAISVHLNTLKKVRIFQDCEAGLLAELVLKLQLQVFSPGDFICRKGDIGREMYIVKRGKISVVGDDGTTVFVTLSEGAVFGELSILNISGNKTGNRRSANVRSVGYSDLFALSKDDLWDALREYPDARKMLIAKGREILKKDNLLDESAPEEQQSPEEIAEELDGGMDHLQTRMARILGEYTNTNRKLRERVGHLEKQLQKYTKLSLLQIRSDSAISEALKEELLKMPIVEEEHKEDDE